MAAKTRKTIVKTILLVVLLIANFVLCSCDEAVQKDPIDKKQINIEQINMLNDVAMENAIVTQRTLYPYHFIKDSDQLNELGRRDLSILIEYFKQYPGQLNIQQGKTASNLYQLRVASVSRELENAGIDLTQVSIADGMPGGSGMATDDVVEIQQADRKVRTSRREASPGISSSSKGLGE